MSTILKALPPVALLMLMPLRIAESSPWVSDQGRHVAFCANYDGTEVTVWNLAEGKEVCRLIEDRKDPPTIRDCAVSDAAGLVVTVSETSLSIWKLSTGELLWADANKYDGKFVGTSSVAFYPDGQHLLTISWQGAMAVRRAIDGTEPVVVDNVKSPGQGDPARLALSPSGDRIYAFVEGNEHKRVIRCWNSNDGSVIGEFVTDSKVDRTSGYAVGSDVVAEVTSVDGVGTLLLWDARQFTELRRIPFAAWFGTIPTLLEARETVFFSGVEYDLNTGEVVSYHAVEDGLWENNFNYRTMRAIPGTSLCCWMNSSDRRVLFLGRIQPPRSKNHLASFQALHGRRDSAVILGSENRGVVTGKPEYVEVFHSKVIQQAGLKPWNKWNYERVPPKQIRNDPAGVAAALKELLTPLPPRGDQSIDRSKPRLFVYAVGISDYEFDEYDLRFCAKDATDLAARLQAERGKQFGDVQVALLTDKQATPAALREGLAWLQRSSTPNDLVVVYFSGHGYRATKGLYYLSHVGDTENIQNTCINWEEVATALINTRSRQIMFLSDTCHAGSFFRNRFVAQNKLAQLLEDATHVCILASSTGEEASLEIDRLEQGAFTHGILEALNGKADTDGDGRVAWSEVETYVCDRVPELTDGTQHPTVVKPAATADKLVLSSPKMNVDAPPTEIQQPR